MAVRHRECSEIFFSSASSDIDPGRYKLYENNYHGYLMEDDQSRQPSANTCKMIVATTWNAGQTEDITPDGLTYFVFTLQDQRHGTANPHFNKEVQIYTHNSRGTAIRYTINKDVDGHYIDALATGTSLAYLKSEYKLPNSLEGPITYLVSNETNIHPYPEE